MSTEGSGASRGGGDDFHNEDRFLAEQGLGLYVVSDGASDRPDGEVAAAVATKALEDFVTGALEDLPERERVDDAIVVQGIERALEAVRAVSLAPGHSGMAASFTMLLTDGHRGVVGHHGDSRAYLIRGKKVVQLTLDQELTAEVPSEALGDDTQVFSVEFRGGDTVVLCTDGAETVVEDRALATVAGTLSPRLLASRIVSTANRRSPQHDATAVVVRIRRDRGTGALELSGAPVETRFGHTLAVTSEPPEPEAPTELMRRDRFGR